MTINSLGELRDFESIVKVPGVEQTVRLHGKITPGNKVTVLLRSGDLALRNTVVNCQMIYLSETNFHLRQLWQGFRRDNAGLFLFTAHFDQVTSQ